MDKSQFQTIFSHELESLNLPQAATVLVHSSLKAFGHVPDGAQTVIDALMEYLLPEGMLLMPALSYVSVHKKQPVFDVRKTPSCVGIIPETFRKMNGVMRSMHPTHSVCGIGKHVRELLAEHHLDHTPCGEHSPFRLLPEVDGYILMLGCGLRPNTSMHAIEELVEPPYLFGDVLEYTLIDENGIQSQKEYVTHDFAYTRQRYDRVTELLTAPALRSFQIQEATCHLIHARTLWEKALAQYKKIPLYFVDQVKLET